MIFQLVENIKEERNLRSILDNMNDHLSEFLLIEGGPRGQTDLRQFICEILNTVCRGSLVHTDFMIHHKDGDHLNNNPKNIVLLPIGIVNTGVSTIQATNQNKKVLTNPNSSIHKNISIDPKTGVIDINDYATYIAIINQYSAIDVWRSLQKHTLIYLDGKLLKRDLNKSQKDPSGRIH